MCLEQSEFEQRPVKRHQRALDRRCQPIGVLYRIRRSDEIVAGELDVRVVKRCLENLAINFEKRGSEWLGLTHRLNDRLLKQTRV